MKRLLRASAAAAALLLLATGCGSGSSGTTTESGKDVVSVGVIPIVDVAPIYLGKEQGFFAERGIDLKLETSQGGAAIVPGVMSGQFQFGFSNVTSLLLAKAKGMPLQVTNAGVSSTGDPQNDYGAVVAPKSRDIRDAADLEGKTVAVNTLNNIGDTTVREVVRQAGGDPSKVEFVELAFPDMPAAVQEGRVDAAWVVEPFVTIATQQGARVVSANFAETHRELMVASYFTTQEVLQSDPDLAKRFTAAMNESLAYAEQNPDAVRRILTSYSDIDKATANAITLPRWPTEINPEPVQRLADLAVRDGLIGKAPNVRELLP
ncbi:MAG: nitrate ABC transporter substrate-binding protein [Actinophytocola sp.]|nr:nitrate ABC transporter substrate-binding protein [Actinophytocola sp.]